MKTLLLAVCCLCAYAQALVPLQNIVGDHIEAHLEAQELNLKVASDVYTEDDRLMSAELVALEESFQRSIVADTIKEMLESFRDVVVNGNDALPPLDPLTIPTIGPFLFTTTGIRASAQVNDFNLQGLRWYVVDDVTFNAFRLAIGAKMTIPWTTVTGNYDASATIALLSHRAGGNFRIFINRLETSVDLRLGTNILGGGTLILRELDILIQIGHVQINIDGMVGSSVLNNLINSFVQNAAQNLLVDQMEEISHILSRELFDAINEILGNFTIDDLLG